MLGSPGEFPATHAADVCAAAGITDAPVAIEWLGRGVKSSVWSIEFAARAPLAVKIYERPICADREQAAYRLIAAMPGELPVPELIASSRREPWAPFGFTAMSHAEGVAFNEQLTQLTAEERAEVYRGVGRFAGELARIECRSFGLVADSADGFATNEEFMAARTAASIEGFRERGGSAQLAADLERYFGRSERAFASCRSPRLCHGDLHPENIRIARDPARFVGVIDFEQAFAGDPAMDLVYAAYKAEGASRDQLAQLLERYSDPPPWLEQVFLPYLVYFELELWNYFASGGSTDPLDSIAERIASAIAGQSPGGLSALLGRLFSRAR